MVLHPSECVAHWVSFCLSCLLLSQPNTASSAEAGLRSDQLAKAAGTKPLAAALTSEKWKQVENAVDRGLTYLASRQEADGSFTTITSGQPGVTSLCVMAFLSRGHQPGQGSYGEPLNKAIDYVLACQGPDGLLSKNAPGTSWQRYEASHTASYSHAIAGLMLGEVYGQVNGERAKVVKQAIQKGLQFTRELQRSRKSAVEAGGWRYLRNNGPESDLSVTAWHLMFMRSARNAELTVTEAYVDEAMAYVRRCFDPRTGVFNYAVSSENGGWGASRGMAGAGILSLSMAGQHQTAMAKAAGDWLLAHPYRRFGEVIGMYDKFFYSTYYCSQAMAQLGGIYWEKFFPSLAEVLLKSQVPDGSWPPEQALETSGVGVFGKTLSTSLAVLSLTPPYQLLPVYQR